MRRENENVRNKKLRVVLCAVGVMCLGALMCGCGNKKNDLLAEGEHRVFTATPDPAKEPTATLDPSGEPIATVTPDPATPTNAPETTPTGAPATPTNTPTVKPTATPTATPTVKPTATPTAIPTDKPNVTPTTTPTPTPGGNKQGGNGKLIVIDAGHQRKANTEKEPDGPDSKTMKAKVSGGTTGKYTGLTEYELNLIVSKKLEAILLERGYQVIMVRTTHDVNISNSERAKIANEAHADAFIRVHANANDDSAVNGAETLCQTSKNPYNANLYKQSRKLSDCVLDALCEECGCKKRHVVETDTMSGINWCTVPVTIVEMGFMTNEKEDRLMATEEYQDKLAKGIADGIDAYFAQ